MHQITLYCVRFHQNNSKNWTSSPFPICGSNHNHLQIYFDPNCRPVKTTLTLSYLVTTLQSWQNLHADRHTNSCCGSGDKVHCLSIGRSLHWDPTVQSTGKSILGQDAESQIGLVSLRISLKLKGIISCAEIVLRHDSWVENYFPASCRFN